jgi:hypothetical protein
MAASFLRPSTFGTKDDDYLKSRFSKYGRPVQLAALWLLDVRELRKINQLVINGSDKTVMSFKESQTSAVGMVAVAVCLDFIRRIFVFAYGLVREENFLPMVHRPVLQVCMYLMTRYTGVNYVYCTMTNKQSCQVGHCISAIIYHSPITRPLQYQLDSQRFHHRRAPLLHPRNHACLSSAANIRRVERAQGSQDVVE